MIYFFQNNLYFTESIVHIHIHTHTLCCLDSDYPEMAHREASVISRMTRYDLLMCPFKVKRRRKMRAYAETRMYRAINRSSVCIEVSEFLRGVTRREENGMMVSRRSRERDRSTDRPSVRPSRRSNDTHRAERVHRCRVSNIDRTGMHYGVTQEEAAVTMGAAAAPGMAGTEPGAQRLHYRTEPKGCMIRWEMSLVSRSPVLGRARASLSVSAALHLSVRSPFLFPFLDRSSLTAITYSYHLPLFASGLCLLISRLRLTLCQLRTDYRRFTLDRQPFLCLPTLPLPSDPCGQ